MRTSLVCIISKTRAASNSGFSLKCGSVAQRHAEKWNLLHALFSMTLFFKCVDYNPNFSHEHIHRLKYLYNAHSSCTVIGMARNDGRRTLITHSLLSCAGNSGFPQRELFRVTDRQKRDTTVSYSAKHTLPPAGYS